MARRPRTAATAGAAGGRRGRVGSRGGAPPRGRGRRPRWPRCSPRASPSPRPPATTGHSATCGGGRCRGGPRRRAPPASRSSGRCPASVTCSARCQRSPRSVPPIARARSPLWGCRRRAGSSTRTRTLVDDLLPVVGVPGLPEVVPDPPAARRFLRRRRRARLRPGAAAPRQRRDHQPAHDDAGGPSPGRCRSARATGARRARWCPTPTSGPRSDRLLAVTTAAGAPSVGTGACCRWVDGIDREDGRGLLGGPGPGRRPYVCLHPGRRAHDQPVARRRTSPPWATTSRAPAIRVVLTGSADEASPDRGRRRRHDRSRSSTSRRARPCGRWPPSSPGARLVVSNDTGAAHLAAAVRAPERRRVPAAGEPGRWAPLDREPPPRRAPRLAGRRAGPTVAAVVDAVDAQLTARDPTAPAPRRAHAPWSCAMTRPLRILTWHVHGNYLWYLSHIPHEIVLPVPAGSAATATAGGPGRSAWPAHGARGAGRPPRATSRSTSCSTRPTSTGWSTGTRSSPPPSEPSPRS